MYYRSMRLPYFKLARSLQIGHLQIYVPCSVEKAQIQNAGREGTVPDEVIWKMSTRLEVPDAQRNCWERNSVVWSEDCSVTDFSNLLKRPDTLVPSPANSDEEEQLEKRRESQEITRQNAVHRVDLILRKRLSELIQTCCMNRQMCPEERKSVVGRLTERKRRVLNRFRAGELVCDIDVDGERKRLEELIG